MREKITEKKKRIKRKERKEIQSDMIFMRRDQSFKNEKKKENLILPQDHVPNIF